MAKAVAAAEPYKAALLERGVLFVPFPTDGGAVPAGASDSEETVDAKGDANNNVKGRWRANPVYPNEWGAWFTEQTGLAKISKGTPVYVSLRMDGRVRASGADTDTDTGGDDALRCVAPGGRFRCRVERVAGGSLHRGMFPSSVLERRLRVRFPPRLVPLPASPPKALICRLLSPSLTNFPSPAAHRPLAPAGVGPPPWQVLASALPPTEGFFAGFLDGAHPPRAATQRYPSIPTHPTQRDPLTLPTRVSPAAAHKCACLDCQTMG